MLVNIPWTKATLIIMNRSRTRYGTFGGKSDDLKDDLREPRSEELCGQVENFSLVGKRSTTGLTDKRRDFRSVCTNAVKLQMPLPTTSREKDSYAAFVRRLKSYLRAQE